MKIFAILSMGFIALSAQAFTVEGELKEVKVGMLGTAIPIKVIETQDETFVVDFKQGNYLAECANGSFELSQVTSNDVEGYDSFFVEEANCLD